MSCLFINLRMRACATNELSYCGGNVTRLICRKIPRMHNERVIVMSKTFKCGGTLTARFRFSPPSVTIIHVFWSSKLKVIAQSYLILYLILWTPTSITTQRDFGRYLSSAVKSLIFPIPCQWASAKGYRHQLARPQALLISHLCSTSTLRPCLVPRNTQTRHQRSPNHRTTPCTTSASPLRTYRRLC